MRKCGRLGRKRSAIWTIAHNAAVWSGSAYGTSPADVFRLLSDDVGYRIFDLDGGGPYALAEFEGVFYAGDRVNFVAHP